MPVYAVGFSNFQCTLLLVVSVEVVPLGSLEGAIDNAVSTVVVAFVAVVFCNTNILYYHRRRRRRRQVVARIFSKSEQRKHRVFYV